MKKAILSMLLLCTLIPVLVFAQPTGLMQMRKPSNMGREYYFSFPPCYEVSGVNTIRLYVASTVRTRVTVEVEGKGLKLQKFTVPNDVIEFTLSPSVAQIFSKPAKDSVPADQVYAQAGIHVFADAPIVVYASSRFDFTSDTFLPLPVEALGKEYIIASMADMSWMYPGLGLPSESVITATKDTTQVTITIGGNAVTKTGGGLKAGQSKTFTLNRGDVLGIATAMDAKEGDLSGTKIVANKPVSVVSGNQCANVPTTMRWCDYIAEMELPTQSWGTSYLIPRNPQRKNSFMMKIFAKEPNTKLYRNGQFWRIIKTAGGIEGTGFIYERVDGGTNNIANLTSDKPISVTIYNPGQEDDGVSSDPFQMIIMPTHAFSKEYMFCTPGIKGGKGFAVNNALIVYPLTKDKTIPDDLEFGTAQDGEIVWKKLSTMFTPTTGDLYFTGNGEEAYAMKNCFLPSDGVYAIRCSKPVGVYLIGGSNYDSYGMPAGGLIFDKEKSADVQPPVPLFTNTGAPTINGTVTDVPNDNAIRSNLSKITLIPGLSENMELKTNDALVYDATTADWKVNVTDSSRDAVATLTFTDRAGNDTTLTIRYSSTPSILSPQGSSFCEGDSIELRGPDGFSQYKWSTGETTQRIIIKTAAQTQKPITLTVTRSNGEVVTTSAVTIRYNPLPPAPEFRLSGDTLYVQNKEKFAKMNLYRNAVLVGQGSVGYFIITTVGSYTLQGTSAEGCTSPLSSSLVYTPVGVQEDEGVSLRVYPVPADDYLMLSMETQEPLRIELHSLEGKQLLSLSINETGTIHRRIDISALPTGAYILQLQSGTHKFRRVIIKE